MAGPLAACEEEVASDMADTDIWAAGAVDMGVCRWAGACHGPPLIGPMGHRRHHPSTRTSTTKTTLATITTTTIVGRGADCEVVMTPALTEVIIVEPSVTQTTMRRVHPLSPFPTASTRTTQIGRSCTTRSRRQSLLCTGMTARTRTGPQPGLTRCPLLSPRATRTRARTRIRTRIRTRTRAPDHATDLTVRTNTAGESTAVTRVTVVTRTVVHALDMSIEVTAGTAWAAAVSQHSQCTITCTRLNTGSIGTALARTCATLGRATADDTGIQSAVAGRGGRASGWVVEGADMYMGRHHPECFEPMRAHNGSEITY